MSADCRLVLHRRPYYVLQMAPTPSDEINKGVVATITPNCGPRYCQAALFMVRR